MLRDVNVLIDKWRADHAFGLANVGPVVVKAARQALRDKLAKAALRNRPKRPVRRPHPAPAAVPQVPAIQLLSGDEAKAAGNPLMKTIGGWIGRLITQPSARSLGCAFPCV